MTGSLPPDVQDVFTRSITTEYVTVDGRGQPIAWPVTPFYSPGADSIAVTTGIGYPKKADDAKANPKVALLFSDPTGSGRQDPPMVLVQGIADVDENDLAANRDRYVRESAAKLPGSQSVQPPSFLRRFFDWYYARIYVNVRPERVFSWPPERPEAEPILHDTHLEEVRTGHDDLPEEPHAAPEGTRATWEGRLEQLGTTYPTAVLAVVGPDGFPFAIRVPVRADRAAGRVHIEADPVAAPLEPGLACLTAHAHGPDFSWQRNFQVRGDLVDDGAGYALVPHKLVGGFEMPPGSQLDRLRANAAKAMRFRRTARERMH
jgi:hypothetical protein